MKNLKAKEETIRLVGVMIQNADKGPSGFWVEDYEGCGNPQIFPEFQDGFKRGRLIQKEHYLCPWNTAIMYGEGHGNIDTGCYHSCSICDAKYLPTNKLKKVLKRFNDRLMKGQYDRTDHLVPLLTDEEVCFISDAKVREEQEKEKIAQRRTKQRREKAKHLLDKYSGDEDLCAIIAGYYGEEIASQMENGYVIDFGPESMQGIVGGEKISYDEYIDLQIQSAGKIRSSFWLCYIYHPLEFKGCIERITAKAVCFKRIYVLGRYHDGVCFRGKEDHVWISRDGLDSYEVGDCLSFFAEPYRYIKTGNGKILDYSLRNPGNIKRIEAYELPSDADLQLQVIDGIICESCWLTEQCNRQYCIRPQSELRRLKHDMLRSLVGREMEDKNETV